MRIPNWQFQQKFRPVLMGIALMVLNIGALKVQGQEEIRTGKLKTPFKENVTSLASKNISDTLQNRFKRLKEFSQDTTASQWMLNFENSYVQDPDSSYFGDGLFSDYSLKKEFNVFNLPISLEGHLIIQNNQINKRFSGINLSFNTEAFVQTYQKKIISNDLSKHTDGDWVRAQEELKRKAEKEAVKLLVEEQLDKASEAALQKIEKDTNQLQKSLHQISAQRIKAMQELDSVQKQITDSLLVKTQGHTDTLMEKKERLQMRLAKYKVRADSIQQRITYLTQQVEKTKTWTSMEQKKLQNLKSSTDVLQFAEQMPRTLKTAPLGIDTLLSPVLTLDTAFQRQLEKIHHKIIENKNLLHAQDQIKALSEWQEKQRTQWEQLSDPNELKRYAASKSFHIKPLHRFLLGMKKLEMGAIQLRDSPQIIGSVPANGFSSEWNSEKIHLGVAVGKEGRTELRQLTDFIRNANRFGLNREVFQVKAGVGNPENSYCGISFTQFKSDIPSTFLNSPVPQQNRNILMGIEGKQYLTKTLFSGAQAVLSHMNGPGLTITQGLIPSEKQAMLGRAAFDTYLGYNLAATESSISFGYSHIGGAYQTLGNPFLITNRDDLKIRLEQKLLKNRLNLNAEARFSTSLNNNITPIADQNLYNVDVSWRIDKKGSRIWAKYQPIVFVQSIGEVQNSLQFNTFQLGGQTAGKIGKQLQWNTVVQLMNFRQESNASDTAFTLGRKYGTLIFALSSKHLMWSLTAYSGFEQGKIKEGQVGQNLSFMFNRIQLDAGIQIIQRPFDPIWRKGYATGFRCHLKKWGEIGINGMWLSKSAEDSRNGFYGSSYVRINI